MSRANRQFEIIQMLRRRSIVRASEIAERLEISERTVYRDIQDLIANGVPVEGEAGLGYMLRPGFDLPPLMFDREEIEALVLGARIVETWADARLADAAGNVLAKVAAVVPPKLRGVLNTSALLAPANHYSEPLHVDAEALRDAVRTSQKISFRYVDSHNEETNRTVRPLGLAFYGPIWLLVSWCELRNGFRSFRLDRMRVLQVCGDTFRSEPGKTIEDYLKQNNGSA